MTKYTLKDTLVEKTCSIDVQLTVDELASMRAIALSLGWKPERPLITEEFVPSMIAFSTQALVNRALYLSIL